MTLTMQQRTLSAAFLAGAALLAFPGAAVSSPLDPANGSRSGFHALEIDRSSPRVLLGARAASLRRHGIRTIVLDPLRLEPRQLREAERRARRAGLRTLRLPDAARDRARCRSGRPCVVVVRDPGEAVRASRRGRARLVVLRVAGPEGVGALPVSGLRTRVLALATLSVRTAARDGAWRKALEVARASGRVDLGLSLRGPRKLDTLERFLDRMSAPPPAPEAPPEPDLFVSPGGSDAGACTREAPCASFARAHELAAPGDVVEVAAGTYPGQTLSPLPVSGPPAVVFRPPPGQRAVLTGPLLVSASHVTVERISAPVLHTRGGAHQVYLDLDLDLFFIDGTQDVSIVGGDVGPSDNHDSQLRSVGGLVPTRVSITGVHFHDAGKTDPGAHVECLQIGSGIDVVISGNRFSRCSDHDLFIRSWGTANGSPHPLRGFRIEGNVFERPTRGFYSLRLAQTGGWPCESFVVENNRAFADMYTDCEARDVRFAGNVQPSMSPKICGAAPGTVWERNLYASGTPCGPGDRVSAAEAQAALAAAARPFS